MSSKTWGTECIS